MAISAKIQLGTGGVAGYNEWEVVYNASTQPTYKTYVGLEVGQPEPQIIWHTPDNASPVPVSATNQNKIFRLTMDVAGANWDTIINSLAPLKRALNGADSQALRSFIRGDANKVRIALKPDGATYTTYYNVIAGTVDDSMAYYTAEAISNTLARQVVFMLTTEPAGYGDSFVLSNSLASSPHMLVDSNSDGLSDGLTAVGSPTFSRPSERYLTGGVEQKFATDTSSDQGWQTGTFSVSGSQSIVAFFDVTHTGDPISLVLRDNIGVIQSKTLAQDDTGGVAAKTMISSSGVTFYRVVCSGTTGVGATTAYLQVRRVSASATQVTNVWCDKVYAQTGTTTAPPAFSSAKTLTNNGVNRLDFWGIPGDMPALIDMSLTATGTNNSAFVFGKRTDGTRLASTIRYLIESTIFSGGAFSTVSNYIRTTTTGASANYFANADNITPADDPAETARAIGDTIFKLYVVARASDTANSLYGQYSTSGYDTIDTDTATATTANTWELWDLGIVNPLGLVQNQSGTSSFYLGFQATINSGSLDIDYALLIPVGEESLVVEGSPKATYGTLQKITYSVGYTAKYLSTWKGSMWTVAAGPQMTRIVYHDYGTARAVTAGNTLALSVTVTPRTSHLLGTK